MNNSEPWDGGVGGIPIEIAMNSSSNEATAFLAPDDLFLSNNATVFGNFTNHTGQLPGTAPDASDNILIWGMSSLIFFIFCGFTRRGPDPTHRAFISRRELRRNEVKKDPEWRQKVIANSVITKRVLSCDENKTLRLGEIEGSISLGESSFSLNSMEDENVSQCVICLESFQRGDYVTWSKSMECLHVFHQECLEEWLINCKHDGCPSCRSQIINYEDGASSPSPDSSSLDGSLDEPSSLAFVIMNGLISPLRRARDSIVGSSINLSNDMDDSSIGSHHNPLSLRRVLSAGATEGSPVTEDRPGLFGVALRRVSTGIYSRLNGTVDAQDEEDEHDVETPEMKNLKQPHMLRRTRSEGLPVTPRTTNSSASYLVLGGANDDLENADIHLDFDLDESNSSFDNCDSPSRTRGIMRLGMRRPKYDHLRAFREECSSEEESLEPQILWRDESNDENEDDIEAGGIEMSPSRLPRLPT